MGNRLEAEEQQAATTPVASKRRFLRKNTAQRSHLTLYLGQNGGIEVGAEPIAIPNST
jgi:hypothetical protein